MQRNAAPILLTQRIGRLAARGPRALAHFALAIWAALACALCLPARAAEDSCGAFAQALPPRSAHAIPASELVPRFEGLSGAERELAIAAEVLAGNFPSFLRRIAPVRLEALGGEGETTEVTFCAMPDYLAIGSDDDFVLVPMRLQTALFIAAQFGLLLPTSKMVDAIYQQAAVRLQPQPLPPGPQMRSTDYFLRHSDMVAAQRAGVGAVLGELTAGDKKDLVLSPRLWQAPQQIAIYGWHRDVGRPIQPLSTVHGARYVDYSHGVRLVAPIAFVQGKARSLVDLLADGRLAPLLSDEGPLPDLQQLLHVLANPADALSRELAARFARSAFRAAYER
ncbi:MAG TPA: hypothetical protein VED83_06610 [Burkholderiaceae bacterium]|nr:hypothetical protein [Burkholderiaceae bacterium]